MELITYLDIWYGIPIQEEWWEEEYDDGEDSGRTARGTAARGKRNPPVRRGNAPVLFKSHKAHRSTVGPKRRYGRESRLYKR